MHGKGSASETYLYAREIDHRRNNRGNNDPEQLEPVEERDADERRVPEIVEGRPQQDDKGEEQKQQEPGTAAASGTGSHVSSPFVIIGVQDAKGRLKVVWIRHASNPTVFYDKSQPHAKFLLGIAVMDAML